MHREESPRARPADAENRGMNAWIHCKRFDSPNVTEAAGLTQWGSSWRRERVPVKTTGMQKPQIRKNCGNLWKRQRPHVSHDAEHWPAEARKRASWCLPAGGGEKLEGGQRGWR